MDPFVLQVTARINAHEWLLEQFFARWFLSDSGARTTAPAAFAEAFRYKAHLAPGSDMSAESLAELTELQEASAQVIERFFEKVEERVVYEERKREEGAPP